MEKIARLALNEEGFAFDPSTGDSYVLNGTGVFILKQFQKGSAEEAVAQALVEEYEVEQEEAARDCADFLARLKSFGLA